MDFTYFIKCFIYFYFYSNSPNTTESLNDLDSNILIHLLKLIYLIKDIFSFSSSY